MTNEQTLNKKATPLGKDLVTKEDLKNMDPKVFYGKRTFDFITREEFAQQLKKDPEFCKAFIEWYERCKKRERKEKILKTIKWVMIIIGVTIAAIILSKIIGQSLDENPETAPIYILIYAYIIYKIFTIR